MNTTDNPWQILSSQEIYDNPWISLTEHQVINPNRGRGIYGSVHFKNIATGILALDDSQNTWLVGQYRFPLKQYSWEIPEGGGALDIHPLESAKRELLEETGLRAQSWTELQRIHLSNSVSEALFTSLEIYPTAKPNLKKPNSYKSENCPSKKHTKWSYLAKSPIL